MDERTMRFRVGVTLLATVLIVFILLVVFGELPQTWLGQSRYDISIKFDRAPGVRNDTPIRKSGILIGRVTDTQLTEDGGVLISAYIHDDVKLRRNERCRVKTSLLGDATLEFVKTLEDGRAEELIQPGEQVEGAPILKDPLEVLADLEDDVAGAIKKFNSASDDVGALAKNLNRLLGDEEKIDGILDDMHETLTTFRKAMASVNGIIGEETTQDDLRTTLRAFPELIGETRTMIKEMRDAVKIAHEDLEDLGDFSKRLGEEGGQMVDGIVSSVENLDEILENLANVSRRINSSEGSLGQLINDPDLYQSLNRAARNIEEASKQLTPIVRDARVVMDKFARHPGIIVRDAIRPGAGLKNIGGSRRHSGRQWRTSDRR